MNTPPAPRCPYCQGQHLLANCPAPAPRELLDSILALQEPAQAGETLHIDSDQAPEKLHMDSQVDEAGGNVAENSVYMASQDVPNEGTNVPEGAREYWIEYKGVRHQIYVDEEDRPFLERFNWQVKPDKNTYYLKTNVKIGGKTTTISMHRLICGLVSSDIDHINRDGLDNRKANLRFATKAENSRNRVRKNLVGYRGVYKPKDSPFFAVQIQINGKKHHERGFETAEEAARRYDELSKEHHGEFGIRNFKD